MAFIQFKFDQVTRQTRDIFNTYIYETDDTIAEVLVTGYFDACRFADSPDWVGSIIQCKCSDTYAELYALAGGATSLVMPAAADVTAAVENNTVSRALKIPLKTAQLPIPISIQGDSTGNEDTEWFLLAWAQIAAMYPAYNMIQYLWSDTNQTFLPPTFKQFGSGGSRFVALNRADGMYGVVTNTGSNFDLTNDLDVRIRINVRDASTANERLLISVSGGTGDRGWQVGITSTGFPTLTWSEDGTVIKPTIASDAAINFDEITYLRCVLDVDNGTGNANLYFYTSTDYGVTWTQLGTTRTHTGTTSVFNSNADLIINGRAQSKPHVDCDFYNAELLNGIGGVMLASPNAALYMETEEYSDYNDTQGNDCTFVAAGESQGSPTIILINCSAPGKGLVYSNDVTRFALQTPIRCVLNFISYGHNEGGASNYYNNYPALIDKIKTKYINAVVVPSTQNPRKAPTTSLDILEHAYRCGIIAQIAASRALPLVEAYGDFLATGNPDDYIKSDGIHPTIIAENGTAISGSQLWANKCIKTLGF